MNILHRYLLRQVFATLVMTVLVFTFVLLLGNALREILELILKRQASPGLIFLAFKLLVLFGLSFSLPMGMLTAVLLAFGRFSADQELIAAKASGISLFYLAAPILGLSVLLSVFCVWINCEVAPSSRATVTTLFANARSVALTRLPQDGECMRLGAYSVCIDHVLPDGTNVQNVRISIGDKNGALERWIIAEKGSVSIGAHDEIIFNLHHAYSGERRGTNWFPSGNAGMVSVPYTNAPGPRVDHKTAVSDMTVRQLLARIQEVRVEKAQPGKTAESIRESEQFISKLKVHMNREIATSFACIGFTLVGIPLGIRAHRRETSIGMVLALFLAMFYYIFIILGEAWQYHPERCPHLLVWLPNLLFLVIGAWLLWRANRRG